MSFVKIDSEEKELVVDVALASSRAQSGRSKSKLSPRDALLRGLGAFVMFRKAKPHELVGSVTELFARDRLGETPGSE